MRTLACIAAIIVAGGYALFLAGILLPPPKRTVAFSVAGHEFTVSGIEERIDTHKQ